MSKVDEMLQILEGMTVLELSELVKACEEKFGVSASAPMAATRPPNIRAIGKKKGPITLGSKAAPKIRSSANNHTVNTEDAYAPNAINPGCEHENSPINPLITFKLKVTKTAIKVNLSTSTR